VDYPPFDHRLRSVTVVEYTAWMYTHIAAQQTDICTYKLDYIVDYII